MTKKILFFSFLVIVSSCSPVRFVKPLQKEEKAVSFNLGGPLIGFAGTTIFIPFTAFTYAQGINDKTTTFGSLHTTSLLFGNIQSDIGVLREIIPYDSITPLLPGITVSAIANVIYGTSANIFKLWPEADVNFYWNLNNKRHFVYAGMTNWFEMSAFKSHNEVQQQRWIISPQVGISGNGLKWISQLELKFLAPNISNKDIVVDYRSPGNTGAIGVYYSITRKF